MNQVQEWLFHSHVPGGNAYFEPKNKHSQAEHGSECE